MKLSIITINYNNRDRLLRTINSVINQKHKNYEYIVIDGGSTDGSLQILEANNHMIDYWVSEKDGGIYNAMNKGIDRAQGDYCIFMNSGDVFYSDEVTRQVDLYLTGEDIITGDMMCENLYHAPTAVTMRTFYTYTLPHQASFIKTTVQKHYKYDEGFRIVSDWKFFLQVLILNNGTYKRLPFTVSEYDVNCISSTSPDLYKRERELVLNQMFPQRVLEDYYYYAYGDSSLEMRFYDIIRDSSYHRIIYFINICIIKIIAQFKRSMKWVKEFPLLIK